MHEDGNYPWCPSLRNQWQIETPELSSGWCYFQVPFRKERRIMAEPARTGRYFVLSHAAFWGPATPKQHNNIATLEDAVKLAEEKGYAAFHYYLPGDRLAGQMYGHEAITSYAPRDGERRCVGVLMEVEAAG
ncbi:MAG: hypothetical protein AAGF11_21405 [Myxococcota bacterium]